jgi:hypothetical protein
MSKFKVGDKVRYIERNSFSNLSYGEVYEVSDTVDLHNSGVRLKCQDPEDWWYDSRFELYEEKNMSNVEFIITPNSIAIAYEGDLVNITKGDHRYEQALKAIKEDRLDDIPAILDVSKAFDGLEGIELVDGRLKINGKLVPDVVTDRVLKFKEQGLPFKPLIKFSEKLLVNPSFNSRQMLYRFLEHNGHPITKEGNFIAYKKVDRDFKDCYTHKMDNSIGATVEMAREEVDDNPENTCSSGLHVAAYNYAKNFSNGHLVEVEIDPQDVVAVPNDYNGEKMRVCKYKVIKVCESRLDDVELYDDEDFPYQDDDISAMAGDNYERGEYFV